MVNRLFRRVALGAGAIVILLIALSPVVLGHAELDSATPGPGDVVTSVPDHLVATFTQDLDPGRSSIEMVGPDGSILARGGGKTGEKRTIRLDLPDLSPGTYTVRWTSWSTEDGELDRGTYTFAVTDADPPQQSVTPESPPGAAQNHGRELVISVVAAVAILGALALRIAGRRARR